MGDKKFTLVLVIVVVAMMLGGVYLATRMESQSEVIASQEASAVVSETSYDWGEIGIDDGKVEKTFEIKNEGTDVLVLSSVETSCMCTTAQVIVGESKSQEFGMHTKSNYRAEVDSGSSAQIKVVFDPAYHGPNGIGPITRQVSVATNDISKPNINFTLTAMVRR